jgi:rubrerythrin
LAKALTVAAYGESVAAYRYRALAEKASTPAHRRLFEEMAEEEHGHHDAVRELLAKYFPDRDYVLSAEDKQLVVVGPRNLDLSGEDSMSRAVAQIQQTERQTGRFYAALSEVTTEPDLKPLLREMADECFEHAQRLGSILPGE